MFTKHWSAGLPGEAAAAADAKGNKHMFVFGLLIGLVVGVMAVLAIILWTYSFDYGGAFHKAYHPDPVATEDHKAYDYDPPREPAGESPLPRQAARVETFQTEVLPRPQLTWRSPWVGPATHQEYTLAELEEILHTDRVGVEHFIREQQEQQVTGQVQED